MKNSPRPLPIDKKPAPTAYDTTGRLNHVRTTKIKSSRVVSDVRSIRADCLSRQPTLVPLCREAGQGPKRSAQTKCRKNNSPPFFTKTNYKTTLWGRGGEGRAQTCAVRHEIETKERQPKLLYRRALRPKMPQRQRQKKKRQHSTTLPPLVALEQQTRGQVRTKEITDNHTHTQKKTVE